MENGFMSLNNGTATRLKMVNGIVQISSPDVSFVSMDVGIEFDWSVSNETLGSDHLVLKMSVDIPNNFYNLEYLK